MPLYVYQCKRPACEHRFELIRPMVERDNQVCPKCGSSAGRQISASALPGYACDTMSRVPVPRIRR